MGDAIGEDERRSGDVAVGDVLREYGTVYLKGIAMGTADSVPGVSGGTIALITGIYERLIRAVTEIEPGLVRELGWLRSVDGRRRFLADLLDRDVPFLLALGVGMITAVVVVSRVAHAAFETSEAATFAFFFGLIAASAVVLYGEVDVGTPGRVVAAVGGFALALAVSLQTGEGALAHSPLVVVVAGAIAISAMILPGISGATFLVLLGQYDFLTGELTAFVNRLIALPTGGHLDTLVDPGVSVVSFLAGASVGLFTVAHAVEWALEHYREATLTFLVSLLAGTLAVPVLRISDAVGTLNAGTATGLITAALLGAAAVIALDRYTDEIDY